MMPMAPLRPAAQPAPRPAAQPPAQPQAPQQLYGALPIGNFGASPFTYAVPTGYATRRFGAVNLTGGTCTAGGSSGGTGSEMFGMPVSLPAMTVTAIGVSYSSISGSQDVQVALYTGAYTGGQPYPVTRETYSSSYAVVAGLNEIPVSAVTIPAGLYYVMVNSTADQMYCEGPSVPWVYFTLAYGTTPPVTIGSGYSGISPAPTQTQPDGYPFTYYVVGH